MKPKSEQRQWNTRAENTRTRHARVAAAAIASGKMVAGADAVSLLTAVLEPGDRVCIEGDNQKQAQVLARALSQLDPAKVHDVHMVQSTMHIPEHLQVFERGIARRLDMSYAGPQAKRLAELVSAGTVQLGAVHTYAELYSRYFIDLPPRVALIAAVIADKNGNLYTGPNTEETPLIVEAAKCRQGIVIAQVHAIVDSLPRVDVAEDWVDYVVLAEEPFQCEPLFTRDPANISDKSILMAMLAIKGIYAPLGITSLNHGIGYDTAAIELLLPTYGAELGLKGKICTHWALNPHPTLIPAIESGFVESVHCFGGEVGMEKYVAARPDVFCVGPDGTLRSNRPYGQLAGQYAVDMFIGSTIEIDQYGNSSTATAGRLVGFGGAPNLGANPGGRRHASPAWIACGQGAAFSRSLSGPLPNGRKVVVQIVQTSKRPGTHSFVERLSAWELAEQSGLALPPVMLYGEDVTHIVTEIGIAHLWRCSSLDERRGCISAVAGAASPLSRTIDAAEIVRLRKLGLVEYPEDLAIDPTAAGRDLLAARSLEDLVEWSGGLYEVPKALA